MAGLIIESVAGLLFVDGSGNVRTDAGGTSCCCNDCWYEATLCATSDPSKPDPVYVICSAVTSDIVFQYDGACYEVGTGSTQVTSLPGGAVEVDSVKDQYDDCDACEPDEDCPTCSGCPSSYTVSFNSVVINWESLPDCDSPCEITFNGSVVVTKGTGCSWLAGGFNCGGFDETDLLTGTVDSACDGSSGIPEITAANIERVAITCVDGPPGYWKLDVNVCYDTPSGPANRNFLLYALRYAWMDCPDDGDPFDIDDPLLGSGFCVTSGNVTIS